MRLLDFSDDGYHFQLFEAAFTTRPSFNDIDNFKISIEHVPIAITNLVHKNIRYIGHRDLNVNDLEGYRVYLEEMGTDEKLIETHFGYLIETSKNLPVKIRLYGNKDGVFADHM